MTSTASTDPSFHKRSVYRVRCCSTAFCPPDSFRNWSRSSPTPRCRQLCLLRIPRPLLSFDNLHGIFRNRFYLKKPLFLLIIRSNSSSIHSASRVQSFRAPAQSKKKIVGSPHSCGPSALICPLDLWGCRTRILRHPTVDLANTPWGKAAIGAGLKSSPPLGPVPGAPRDLVSSQKFLSISVKYFA